MPVWRYICSAGIVVIAMALHDLSADHGQLFLPFGEIFLSVGRSAVVTIALAVLSGNM